MYIPVCLVGYLSYGDSLRDSVINSIQTKWIQQTINVTITLHLILSLTIVFNPLNQEVEEYFKIPLGMFAPRPRFNTESRVWLIIP